MGEERVKQISDDYIILRLALLYGFGLNHSISYFQKMYEDLSAGKEVILFTDQYRTPLEVTAAADIIAQLNSKNISGEIINCGGQERVSRYKLGEILCSCAGFDTRLLVPAKMNEVPGYPIVEDVSMNSDKLKSLGINPLSIKESINNILNKVRT
jgi:dTDP-4-dehydrorhamnose reductase